MEIKFSESVEYLGRNGWFKMKGISLAAYNAKLRRDADTARIEPINSKGNIGRACLEIPIKDIPALIKALKKIGGC